MSCNSTVVTNTRFRNRSSVVPLSVFRCAEETPLVSVFNVLLRIRILNERDSRTHNLEIKSGVFRFKPFACGQTDANFGRLAALPG